MHSSARVLYGKSASKNPHVQFRGLVEDFNVPDGARADAWGRAATQQAHHAALFSENGASLVQDAARDTHEFIFHSLAQLCKPHASLE